MQLPISCKNCKYSIRNNTSKLNCSQERTRLGVYKNLCYDHSAFSPILPQPETKKYSPDSYYFQGPINFTHLCNDCLREEKHGFIVLTKTTTFFGLSRQAPDTLILKYKKDFRAKRIHDTYLPFHVFSCDKYYTIHLMDRLRNIEKAVKKEKRKVAKELHQMKKDGEFSNKPKTKIMVF